MRIPCHCVLILKPLCLACVGAAEVWFVTQHLRSQVCALSSHCCPQTTPTSQRCSGQSDTRAADMVTQFAHFPLGYLARQRCLLPSYLICVCTLLISTTKPFTWMLFFLCFFPLCLWHTMFIHTFQSWPWQLVSAYWVTCLTPLLEPAVERSAQRWREVGELCYTHKRHKKLCLIYQCLHYNDLNMGT